MSDVYALHCAVVYDLKQHLIIYQEVFINIVFIH